MIQDTQDRPILHRLATHTLPVHVRGIQTVRWTTDRVIYTETPVAQKVSHSWKERPADETAYVNKPNMAYLGMSRTS